MKKVILFLSGCALVAMNAGAQTLKEGYITPPQSPQLHNYIGQWSKSNPHVTTVDGKTWEDENFYISRVKIKPYITNTTTQVFENINASNDKKLLFWVPVGNTAGSNVSGVFTGSLPNGMFDSEVFSMWPYVTFYGDWIAPYGWIPGGFADAAHKHGTAVAGQASIPNASLSGDWSTCIQAMGTNFKTDDGAKKVGDFLNYYGVDGLGYNSEFSTSSTVISNLNQMHGKLYKYMHNTLGNDKFENIWYTGTVDNGNINFTSALHSGNTGIFGNSSEPRTSLFVNYEWLWYLSNTNSTLPGTGRDGRDLYMGMNMQAGTKDAGEWPKHKETNFSIGLWGAHDFNYLWSARAGKGSRDDQKQAYYQERLEQWFTNGNRNPANRIDVAAIKNLSPSETWHGMSQFMSARSTLGWNIADEPFVTFFNLGNGKFLNWKGERQNNNEWYNIGVQDYMPTWRFWFATEVLGNTPDKVAADGLKAEFTWDDAYVGGSCLYIHGNTDKEYLHLFKTAFELNEGDVITVRYKLMGGSADVNLVMTAEGSEFYPIQEEDMCIITSDDQADDGDWYVKKFVVGDDIPDLDGQTVALVGFDFENADNLQLYLGEFSIKSGNATATPAAPVIDASKTKVLTYNNYGVDGKIIFNMNSTKPSGEPVYNTDVNVSLFKLYAQYQGGEPQFMGLSSSWAGLIFAAQPDVETVSKVRFGVSAVSVDTDSESTIAWSDYMSVPAYETDNTVSIDKQVIKPGETFTVGYRDPMHAAATWNIYNSENQKVASSNGAAVSYTCPGLDKIGGYDLEVICNGSTQRFAYFIQVSSKSTGALPEIESLTINDVDAESSNAEVTFNVGNTFDLGYTGREADGAASRGIKIDNQFVGAKIGDLGLTAGAKNFSIAGWVKYDLPSGSSRMFGVDNRASNSWPVNNWGWCWLDIAGTGADVPGKVGNLTFRTSTANGSAELKYFYDNSVVPNGAWTHIAYTFEWNASQQLRAQLYINGKLQTPTSVTCGTTSGTATQFWSVNQNKNVLGAEMWFYLAGGAGSSPLYNDGVVDDIVVWEGVMTEAQVAQVMAGLDSKNLPSNVIAYWDLEDDADNTNKFAAKGQAAGAGFCNFSLVAGSGEGSGVQTPSEPQYEAGSPFIGGTSYPVVTKPTWSTRKIATIVGNDGTDVAGKATVSFPREGNFNVKLTLDNSHGYDEREYPVFTIHDDLAAIEGVNADEAGLEAYTINSTLFLQFATEGNYVVNVYNVNGQLVGKKAQNIAAGQNMSITLANAGVYIVNVVKDGNVVRNIKVVNQK